MLNAFFANLDCFLIINKSGCRGKRKYQVPSRFPPLKYAHLWKRDVDFTIVQAGWALLDFCTEYGVMLITFSRLLFKKILSVKSLEYTVTSYPSPVARP